ncbi:phosphodiesterase [Plantactinospora sp. CA-290183]|uniref:phosphodiesterase n=1 Tax=Plantactinospora sp. CA-290183 TaxID=3240006 RepID=UPI003D8EE1EA
MTGRPPLGRIISRLRGGRLLHPRGRSFCGEIELWGPFAAHLAGGPGRWPATVRLSRGTPTPEGWPDLLGLAVRIHRHADPVDLLVSSAGRLPLLRHLPTPRRDFGGPYTSILSYRLYGRRVYLAALPERPLGTSLDQVTSIATGGGAGLRLAVASVAGRWRQFGRISFGEPAPDEVDAALAFDPIGNRPDDLRTVGLIQRMRVATYAASRHTRAVADPVPPADAASETRGR